MYAELILREHPFKIGLKIFSRFDASPAQNESKDCSLGDIISQTRVNAGPGVQKMCPAWRMQFPSGCHAFLSLYRGADV
jgi:hypothetical protein